MTFGSQDDDEPRYVPTFVFKSKGREAAEDFLLARYRLYTQVYLHKTTRGFEQIFAALFQHIGRTGDAQALGLDDGHPLWRFLRPDGESLEDYRRLDDGVVWGAVERLCRCSDSRARALAERLHRREHLKVLDVSAEFGYDPEKLHNALRKLEKYTANELGNKIFRDEASYNLYTRASGEAAKAHKMVRVQTGMADRRRLQNFPTTS
jgi:phosphohydrolase domain-containing protein